MNFFPTEIFIDNFIEIWKFHENFVHIQFFNVLNIFTINIQWCQTFIETFKNSLLKFFWKFQNMQFSLPISNSKHTT